MLTACYPRVGFTTLAALVAGLAEPAVAGAAGHAVALGTCHRAEIYVDASDGGAAELAVREAWAKAAGLSEGDLAAAVEKHAGPRAARHLFTVATGLESVVLGEAEIGGQVAAALRAAHDAGTTSPLLEDVFQSACRAARRVASETSLGRAGRSLASVALSLSGVQQPGRAVIVGTGSFARVFVAQLRELGCADLSVYSPSGRAAEFAAGHGARAIAAGDLEDELAACDLAILCSGLGEPVITGPMAARVVARRGGEPLRVADLALIPDAAGDVPGLPGVRYLGLSEIAQLASAECGPAEGEAQGIVEQELRRLRERRAARSVDPAIVALRQHIEEIARREVSRLPGGSDAEAAGKLAHRISQSLLHVPTERGRQLAAEGSAQEYVHALDVLYGLRVELGQGESL